MFPAEASGAPVVGTLVHTKPRGYSRVRVVLSCAPDSALETGEVIEMQVWLAWSEADGGTVSGWYVGAFKVDTTWTSDWREVEVGFEGFSRNDDLILNIMIVRLNDTDLGTNADENFYVRRTSVYPEP